MTQRDGARPAAINSARFGYKIRSLCGERRFAENFLEVAFATIKTFATIETSEALRLDPTFRKPTGALRFETKKTSK